MSPFINDHPAEANVPTNDFKARNTTAGSPFHETSVHDYTPSDPKERTSFFALIQPPPEPKTELGVYRLLSPSAGIRVSPLCLGAMNLGTQWTGLFAGKTLDLDGACKYLDTYYDSGGNWVDVASNYQDGQSEYIVGEWMKRRGNRDDMVISTKYTSNYMIRKEGFYQGIGINYTGNQKKSLMLSLKKSLAALQTSYLDILYVHYWDYTTSIPEMMQSLNDVVRSGSVHYLGISDTPAWIVAAANDYAAAHGMAQFVIYQGKWNLGERDMEREIIPMCQHYKMGIAPWGVLTQGRLQAAHTGEERNMNVPPLPNDSGAVAKLAEIAKELGGVSVSSVLIAWIRQKASYVFPIIGGHNATHLKENIDALKITLSNAQMAALDQSAAFDPGFPFNLFGTDPHANPGGMPNSPFTGTAGQIRFVPRA